MALQQDWKRPSSKRHRRKYSEVQRTYHCDYPSCGKSYGTLNHLNTHIRIQSHGATKSHLELRTQRLKEFTPGIGRIPPPSYNPLSHNPLSHNSLSHNPLLRPTAAIPTMFTPYPMFNPGYPWAPSQMAAPPFMYAAPPAWNYPFPSANQYKSPNVSSSTSHPVMEMVPTPYCWMPAPPPPSMIGDSNNGHSLPSIPEMNPTTDTASMAAAAAPVVGGANTLPSLNRWLENFTQ